MKLLYITSLSGKRINGFMRSAVLAAKELRIDFTMACNMDMADTDGYIKDCEKYGIKTVHVDFDRNPLGSKNRIAYKQLSAIINRGAYDMIHCNTPVGGLLGRICAHKAKVPIIIYQAHGFHFWKGAPVKNWLLYYPVERLLAHWTDILITINQEDYQRAKRFRLHKEGHLILHPGVGVNIREFQEVDVDWNTKRAELGLTPEQIVFITVGELIDRKNHDVLVDAVEELNREDAILLIVGSGEKAEKLQLKIQEKELQQKIRLLGFRTDIKELLKASDCFLFPSFQEGLPGALMEAMASGLPCIASKIRGNIDALEDSDFMFKPSDCDALVNLMKRMFDEKIRMAEAEKNKVKVKKFDIEEAISAYKAIYRSP